jgi:soluble lytic murein transglycosylase-like protein
MLNRIWKLIGYAVAALVAVPLCAHADIYRFVDENGTVHFSNIPSDARFRLYMATKKEPDAVSNTVASRIVHSYPKAARSRYHAHIVAAARTYQLEPALLHAVISAESGYNPLARSSKGARGLMQLMPATARRYGVDNPLDPEQNIYGGAAYLHDLLALFGNDVRLALAAYNAGESTVIEYGNRIPPYRETTLYVPKVLTYYKQYKSLM